MLEVTAIKKKYRKNEVLKGICFSAREGEIISLIGHNGSGKTTLFRILAGLLKPDEGEVLYDDQPLMQRQIGYLSEQRSLYQDVTVLGQLRLVGGMAHMKEDALMPTIGSWLEKISMVDKANTVISQLSKGNQQKIALAACLLKNPKIILMDEPFTGLDEANINLFKTIICQLRTQHKIVLVSSHLYQPINEICDRFLILKEGIIAVDRSRESLQQDEQRVVEVQNREIYFADIDPIRETETPEGVRYYFENAQKALGLLNALENSGMEYLYRHLRVEDL